MTPPSLATLSCMALWGIGSCIALCPRSARALELGDSGMALVADPDGVDAVRSLAWQPSMRWGPTELSGGVSGEAGARFAPGQQPQSAEWTTWYTVNASAWGQSLGLQLAPNSEAGLGVQGALSLSSDGGLWLVHDAFAGKSEIGFTGSVSDASWTISVLGQPHALGSHAGSLWARASASWDF